MCRIAGYLDHSLGPDYDHHGVISAMADVQRHGGPDAGAVFVDAEAGFALGHRRLAIIDLSPAGAQPMRSHSGRFVASYNGELYNFEQIKAELQALGHRFVGRSDTEVLLAAWEQWGHDCLPRLRGMFGIAIWDRAERKLTLVRDRLGVKPLYYQLGPRCVLFSSELKGLRAHPRATDAISRSAVAEFLTQSYIAAPRTIFENTWKLRPGHYLEVTAGEQPREVPYWEARRFAGGEGEVDFDAMGDEEYLNRLEALLSESISLRAVADVTVGCFLSGGVDSSLVTALLQKQSSQKVQTFTIGFHSDRHDEAAHAKKVAEHLGTDHTELYCGRTEAMQALEALPFHFDEPFGDSSAIPTYLVSHLARTRVKVVMSGDGGDELYYGYPSFFLIEKIQRLQRSPLSPLMRSMHRLDPSWIAGVYGKFSPPLPGVAHAAERYRKLADVCANSHWERQLTSLGSAFSRRDLAALVPGYVQPPEERASLLDFDLRSGMTLRYIEEWLADDALVKVDRASMAHGLEVREPLLDHELVQFALRSPHRFKVRDGRAKWALRQVLYRHVPRELINRPKQGFAIPIEAWLKTELRELTHTYLDPSRIAAGGILDAPSVARIRSEYFNGNGAHPAQVWNLLMFEMWRDAWHKAPS